MHFTVNIQLKININCSEILQRWFLYNNEKYKMTLFQKKGKMFCCCYKGFLCKTPKLFLNQKTIYKFIFLMFYTIIL